MNKEDFSTEDFIILNYFRFKKKIRSGLQRHLRQIK